MLANAVFEGGGIKALGLIGALRVAEEKGYQWRRIAGTSAGSIIATLLKAGYSAKEIYQTMINQDFMQFIPPTGYHRVPYAGPAIRLWLKKGMYSGDHLEARIEELLRSKGIRTFADFSDSFGLYIIAADITRGKLLVLPNDLHEYGYDLDEISVAKVVRMSCSIPFFFDPVKLIYRPKQMPCYIVDGAILSNFPVWIFDDDLPRYPTFGFRLSGDPEGISHKIEGPFSLFRSVFLTMMDAHDNRYIQYQDEIRTIQVPSADVGSTEFSLNRQRKEKLYQAGVKAAESFFDSWSFGNYLAAVSRNKAVTYTIQSLRKKVGNVR